eukprot:scaffold63870_cov48-Attheya_sp.AAC.1
MLQLELPYFCGSACWMRVLIFRSVLGLVARLVGWVVFHPQNWVAHPQNFASLAHPQKLGMVWGAV